MYFKGFSEDNVNFVMDLLDKSQKFKSWHAFKTEYKLNHKVYFQLLQLTDLYQKHEKILLKLILTIIAP